MAKFIVVHGAVKIGKKFVRAHVDKKTGKVVHPEIELDPEVARHIDPKHQRLLTPAEFQKRHALEKAERELEDEKKKSLSALAAKKTGDEDADEDYEDEEDDKEPPAKQPAPPAPAAPPKK